MLLHGAKGACGRPDALLPPPVRLHAGGTPALPGGASVDRNSFRSPAIAIAPQCSHTERRGRVGVLTAEMGDGTQGACQKIYPCERLPSPTVSGDALGARASGAQAGETPALPGSASVDRNSFRSPAIAIAPQCSYTGRRGRVGVLKFEMGDGAQGLPENLASARLHVGETTALPGGARADRNSCRSSAIAVAPQCSLHGAKGACGAS
jgi:hypothetical protein